MDEGKECGDFTVTQEWLRKEDGRMFLLEEVVETVPHRWKRIKTDPGGAWGPAEYEDECILCGVTKNEN